MSLLLRIRVLTLIVAVCPAPLVFAVDPSIPFRHLGRRAWLSEAGLPGTVTAVAQTRDGYMWIGTSNGLARFDGLEFTIFDKSNTPAFAVSSYVRSLTVDRAGTLWIGSGGGVVRYSGGRFSLFSTREGLSSDDIGAGAVANDGSMLFGTSGGGVLRHDGGRFTSIDFTPWIRENRVPAVIEDDEGALWFATIGYGLGRLRDGKVTFYRQPPFHQYVTAFHRDANGDIWIGTDSGAARWRNGAFTFYGAKEGLAGHVSCFYRDEAGTLWIGTTTGLSRFRDGRFTTYTTADGLSDAVVYSIGGDAAGNLWVGTLNGGLNQFREATFYNYTSADGMATDAVAAVLEARDGALWVAGRAGDVSVLRNGRWRTWGPSEGLPQSAASALAEDAAGAIWVGTRGGAFRIDDRGVVPFTTTEGLSSNHISAVVCDLGGDVWVSTRGGDLNRIRNGRITHYGPAQGLQNTRIHAMIAGVDGSIYFASRGLFRFAAGRFTELVPFESMPQVIVTAIYQEPDGTLWIAHQDRGLSRWKNGRLHVFTTRDGLPTDGIRGIADDGRGSLWLSSAKGVFRIAKHDFALVAEKRAPRVNATLFTVGDGLATNECSEAAPSAIRLRDGRVAFGTGKGLALADPRHIRTETRPPAVLVESVLADLEPVADGRFELPPGTRRIEFVYTGLSYSAPDNLQFRYRLEGEEERWSEPTERRRVSYTNLPPGNYRFIVQARLREGAPWVAEASQPLRLAPWFYQTALFRLLLVAAIILLLWWLDRLRVRLVEGKAAVELLRLSRKSEMVLRSTADGIVGVELDGTIAFANAAAMRLLQCDEDPGGRFFHDLVHAQSESHGPGACPLLADVEQPRAEVIETFRVACGESQFPAEYSRNAVFDENRRVVGAVFAFRDIVHRMEIERMKAEFVATVGHELRTPLTSIGGSLGLLATEKFGALTVRGRRVVEIALENSDRLLRLVDEILDGERMRNGGVRITRVRCEAADLLDSACEVMRGLASRSNVRIVQTPFAAALDADPDRVIQVLTNLIGNAVKFSPPGGAVTVGGAFEGRFARFTVTDEGRGIPEEKLELVFERFVQVEAGDQNIKGGTGLGLTICRAIVKEHGGTIGVKSALGRGSSFSFTLPLALAESLSSPTVAPVRDHRLTSQESGS